MLGPPHVVVVAVAERDHRRPADASDLDDAAREAEEVVDLDRRQLPLLVAGRADRLAERRQVLAQRLRPARLAALGLE
ncbi:MAG: hypothetical protein ACK559_13700, partial [bacterium]